MTEIEFERRTQKLALEVIRFVDALPRRRPRKSNVDMIAKLNIVEEEADVSGFWMELWEESGKTKAETVFALHREAEEILAMTVASIKTLRAKLAANPKSKI